MNNKLITAISAVGILAVPWPAFYLSSLIDVNHWAFKPLVFTSVGLLLAFSVCFAYGLAKLENEL